MIKINKIKTHSEPAPEIKDMDSLKQILEPGVDYQVLAWLTDYVAFGNFINGKFDLLKGEPSFESIESIRLFNDKQEIYLYRAQNTDSAARCEFLIGRIISEGEGEEKYVKDADQLLLGTNLIAKEDFSTLREDRGFEITVPNSWVENMQKGSRPVLKTRNYLTEWENGQLSYDDHRFVSITMKGGKSD